MVRTRSGAGIDSPSTKKEANEEIVAENGNSIDDVGEDKDDNVVEEENVVEEPSDAESEEDGSDEDEDEDESESDDDEKDGNEESHKIHVMPSRRKSLLLDSRKKKKTNAKNALTHLIPGYTAPMRLDSSSLDKYRCGIKELGRRAQRKDASTKDFVLEATAQKANNSMKKTKEGFLPKSYTSAYSHFKRGAKRAPDDTAGKGWFGMKPSAMTDELKTDLAMIRNRTYLDPKRFYKSSDKHHSVVQVGTVIEGAAEFYSSRLTKKERRTNLTEELMADKATLDYAKNKFKKMAREKSYQAELRKNKPKKRARKFY